MTKESQYDMGTSSASPLDARFVSGARWLRADFHLHTPADGHFDTRGINLELPASWQDAWVNRLAEEEIRVGVITNHNKFDLEEFKALRKRCIAQGIMLLPGVELSVQGGSGAVHILVVFDPASWIDNRQNKNLIDRFLGTAFEHITNYETEDKPCRWTLGGTLEKLEEHHQQGRDSFIVLAHVDDDKGAFHELGSGLANDFGDRFKRFVLGAQKVRNLDTWNNLKQWLNDEWKPARLEGSDPKSIKEVGAPHTQKGEAKVSYVKLGELSFFALRMALIMKEQRVRGVLPASSRGHIETVSFTGGLLDGQTIIPSPELTNLIGIRGSGKSSVLEAIRYAFEIDLKRLEGEDIHYKETLVQRILGSGGSIRIQLSNGDGTRYTVSRVLHDSPVVSRDGVMIPDIRPTSLLTVRYFGQKELAHFSERKFAHELVERFAGGGDHQGSDDILRRIQSLLLTLQHHDAALEQLEDVRADLAAVAESLKGFEEHNLHKKLQSQITFEHELRQATDLLNAQGDLVQSLQLWYDDNYEPYRRRLEHLEGSHLNEVLEAAGKFLSVLSGLHGTISALQSHQGETTQAREQMDGEFSTLRDRFAEVRRSLSLPENLSPDTYLSLSKREKTLGTKLTELESIEKKRSLAHTQLEQSLAALQQRWQEQFQAKQTAVQALNTTSEGVQIKLTFKADKDLFTAHLSTLTTNIQKRTLEKIAHTFSDGIEIYRDLNSGAHRLLAGAGLNETQVEKLREAVDSNTHSFITFRPPDRVDLTYRGTPLHEHSLGQRATALMLFLLSQDDIDVLIVDQPEDDLDNQTVYADIVTKILARKGQQQIIFATHNPNIPVLGDAEQIVRCRFAPEGIDITQGAVDNGAIQKEIVDVMEGGDDAFRRRQRIYDSWTR